MMPFPKLNILTAVSDPSGVCEVNLDQSKGISQRSDRWHGLQEKQK